jgi:hypothetical protein
MLYIELVCADGTPAFCTITVISHAAMCAVCVAATETFRFQSKVCVIVIYEVFHSSLLLSDFYVFAFWIRILSTFLELS